MCDTVPPLKRCNHPSCRVHVPFTESYCDKHVGKVNQVYNRYYDTKDKKYKDFYNSRGWINTRQVALIDDDWLCQVCKSKGVVKVADMVDHTVPVKENWDMRLELSNLKSMCWGCHNKKTADDKKKYK